MTRVSEPSVTQHRDLRTGRRIWLRHRRLPLAIKELARSLRCDVVIVGAGISGALIAETLSDAGLDVVVVDRRGPAAGSTAASTAMLQYEIDLPLSQMARRIGAERATRIWRRSRLAVDALRERTERLGLDVGAATRSTLYLDGNILDPAALADTAIVQVYAAQTYGWRGHFAVHPWLIWKRQGETAYTRYEVTRWGGDKVVRRNGAVPDGLWFGAMPSLLVDHRGSGVEAMIDDIEAAIERYPYAYAYRTYPGPNSNTFLAHIGREVPALRLDLPANAIGKDYRPLSEIVGLSPSGAGVQATLLGMLGLIVGPEEGIEFNILGLSFGLDFNHPGLRLPFVGRLGMDDATVSHDAAAATP